MSFLDLNRLVWNTKSPYEKIAPEFCTTDAGGSVNLQMKASNNTYTFGEWYAEIAGTKPGHVYKFSASFTKEGTGCNVSAILTWLDGQSIMVSRDYAYCRNVEDGLVLECAVATPEACVSVRIELFMACKGEGFCSISGLSLSDEGEYQPRNVKLATTFIDYSDDRNYDKNMADAERVITLAAEAKPDIIVLGENIYDRGLYHLPIPERSITIPGDVYNRLAGLAKKYGTYLVFSVHEEDDGLYYNTAVLIDRNGMLAGKYRKTHLTINEMESGLITGDELLVFETDFGKVGILICWDHWFPESARLLYLKGAEIICIPTAGFIEYQSRARAAENGVYIVTSCMMGPEMSRIIDKDGEVIAQVQADYAAATIDLNKGCYQYWLSVGPAWGEGRSIYINERRPEIYSELCRPK